MSLGSRLIVLLFVTKVLGTCTCSCTWLKKIDVLDAIQVLQIFFELVLANLKSTWLLLDSSTSESTWPQPWECTSPLAALKYVYQADKNCDVLKACSWITYGVNLNVGHYQIHQCQKFCSQLFFQVHTLVACIEWWMNPGRLAAVFKNNLCTNICPSPKQVSVWPF